MGRTRIAQALIRDLKEKKENSRKRKNELIDYLKRLNQAHFNKKLSGAEYVETLHKKNDGRNIKEWVDYYENYSKNCEKEIKNQKKELIKSKIPVLFFSVLLISVFIYLSISTSFFNVNFTGFLVGEQREQQFSQDINLTLDKSTIYNLQLKNLGQLTSLKINGLIEGKGEVKIYLENLLILDSSSTENKNSKLTGHIIEENPVSGPLEETNNSYSEKEAPSKEESSPSQRELLTENNQTITENISNENTTQENSSNQSYSEEQTQPGQSGSEAINESEALPKEESSPSQEEPQPSEQNTTSIQNKNATITSVRKFTEVCAETCNLTNLNLNESSYNLRIEITNAKLQLDTINYTLIPSEISQKANLSLTENVTINTTQYAAVLGQPVKWKKHISLNESGSTVIQLPKEAENIVVNKIIESYSEKEAPSKEESSPSQGELLTENNSIKEKANADIETKIKPNEESTQKQKTSKITGNAISGETSSPSDTSQEITQVIINDNATEYEIEYETPAPYAIEENISNGKRVKIVGSEEVHYENVLSFTNISEKLNIKNPSNIKIHWIENNTDITPTKVEDKNNNGIYDYIEWVAPHLSNQTFDIIIITTAEHLDSNRTFISDIYEEVKLLDNIWSETISSNEYVRVTFEIPLDNTRDITLYPRIVSGNPTIEVYEKDGTTKIAEFRNLNSNEYNKIYLTNLKESQDTFDLEVKGGSIQFDYIVDPTSSYTVNSTRGAAWSRTATIDRWNAKTNATASAYANMAARDGVYERFWGAASNNQNGSYRFNFTLNENAAQIQALNITFVGYENSSSAGDAANVYVWNGNGTWMNVSVVPHASNGMVSVNITNFPSYYVNTINGTANQVVVLVEQRNLDASDSIFIDYVGLTVITDTAVPTMTFEEPIPTPTNGSSTTSPVTIVADISDDSNTSAWMDLDKSLVGYWAMDYYNATGIFDNSTYNNFAKFVAGTGLNYSNLSAGARGKSLRFDGSDDSLDAGNILDLRKQNWTYSLWFREAVSQRAYILSKGAASGDHGVRIETWTDQRGIVYFGGNSGYTYAYGPASIALDDGNWHNIVVVFNRSGNAVFYTDTVAGTPVDISSYVSDDITSPADFFISGATSMVNGYVDEVMVFNRTLSSTEIAALYSSQINKFNTSSMNLSNGQHNYTVYTIDAAGNANNSGWRYFNVGTDSTPPTYSQVSVNNTLAGVSTNFSINVTDNTALHPNGGYIFSTNNTWGNATWKNDSFVLFTTTPSWANVTKVLNSTAGTWIGYRWYFNDSAGNTNSTPIYNLTTTGTDTTPPTITFEEPIPTPQNSSSTTNPITIVANISDTSNTSSLIDLDRSLLGYWSMDYYNSTGVYDNSTYNNFGTFNGAFNYSNPVTGARGNARRFNGINDYIQLGFYISSANIQSTGTTWGMWIKTTNTPTVHNTIITQTGDAAGSYERYGGMGVDNNGKAYFVLYNGSAYILPTSTTSVNDGQWHYVTGVFTLDDNMQIYVDGSLEDTEYAGVAGDTGANNFRIASGDILELNMKGFFNGSIDEVVIFNRSLSSTEIKALYDSKNNKFNTSSMNLANGQHNYTVYAIDASGNANNSGLINFNVNAQDLSPPTITFDPSTPSNTSSTASPVTISANISDTSNTSSWIDFDKSLVGYWAMDYYNSTVMYDNSTYNNFGTFAAGTGLNYSNLTTGVRGKALSFDGVDDYINASNTASLNSIGCYNTISMWLKPAQLYAYEMYISKYYASTNDTGFDFGLYTDGRAIIMYRNTTGPTSDIFTTNTIFSLNTWVHLVVVQNGSNIVYIYKNGNLLENLTGEPCMTNPSSSSLTIGDRGNGQFFNGSLDEVMIFNRSLSSTEISALYNSQSNEFNTSSMSLASGQHNYTVYAIDASGNANNSGWRYFTVDTTPPIYSQVSTNNSVAGQITNFAINVTDNVALQPNGAYIFSTNNSNGVWTNNTAVNFTAISQWANITKTLNSTVGTMVGYMWYFNDSVGNMNSTSIYVLTTTAASDTTPPTITFEEPPTPINASTNATSPVTIVANISDQSNTSSLIDLDRSLLGYWAMDYYNATGIYDNSTYNNFGKFAAGTGLNYSNLTTGVRGQALKFDGVDDYINASNTASLNSIGCYNTISMWIKPTGVLTNYEMYISKYYASTTDLGFDFGLMSDGRAAIMYRNTTSPTSDIFTTNSVFSLNNWIHLVVVQNGSNVVYIYKNGNLLESLSGEPCMTNPSSSSLTIGDRGEGYFFNGSLDEVMIFNRSLSSTEVSALYSSQSNKFNTSSMNLSNGQHNYTVYAVDASGNAANSGLRNFIVTSGGSDSTPPTYSQVSVNNTLAGVSTNFSINVTDNTALQPNGVYIFSTNNTGTWINNSGVNFTAISQFINVTKILNSTVGTLVGYRWYLNDSAGNTNSTSIYVVTTTSMITCATPLSTAGATYTLTSNVTSTGTCFTISNQNIILDCNGYWINYSTNGNDGNYGVYALNQFNITIKNCNILDANRTTGYWSINGIQLDGTTNSTLLNNFINNSNSAGIYLTSGANYNNLTGNTGITDTTQGIRLDHASNYNLLINNTGISRDNEGTAITDSSSFNTFINHTTRSSGPNYHAGLYLMQAAHNNTFINLNTTGTSGGTSDATGIYINNASNNVFIDCISLSGVSYDIYYNNIGGNFNNTFLNCSYNISKETVQGTGSQLIRKWYYQTYVNYTNGSAASNANMTATNNAGKIQFTILTDSSGWITRQQIIDYNNTGTRTFFSNYTITANKSGYTNASRIYNFTVQQNQVNDYFNLTGPDLNPPTYTQVSANNTIAGQMTNFVINITDETALHPNGQYIFSTNNTGAWINYSAFGVKNYWQKDLAINASLPSVGSYSAPTVFYKDSSWYLISGNSNGGFAGYAWNGTNWKVNTTINSSLFNDTNGCIPTVFYKDSSWYFLTGDYDGKFYGYAWNGTQWLTNLTINSSLQSLGYGFVSAPTVFYKDSSWYLISGNKSGSFYGYAWNGTQWLTNLTINASLPSIGGYSTPSVFYKDGNLYLISGSGNFDGKFYGYKWNGANWVVDLKINASLPTVADYSVPSVFNKDGILNLIIGGLSGNFYGYNYSSSYNFTSTPSWANITAMLNSTVGTFVGYRWYFDDNASNTNSTPIYTLTTTTTNAVAPVIYNVTSISPVTLTEGPGKTFIIVNFSVYDFNGASNLNNASAAINFTKAGEALRYNSSCTVNNFAGNYANYSCNVTMFWWDSAGSDWKIYANISDLDSYITVNDTTTFTVNSLTGFVMSPSTLTFSSLSAGSVNQTPTNYLTMNNTGNTNITNPIQINATDLVGETDHSKILWASNFSASNSTGGNIECNVTANATAMVNNTFVSISNTLLSVGNYTKNDGTGQEQIYLCARKVGIELTQQQYSTNAFGSWTIKIVLVSISIRRKRKKNSKNSTNITIPSTIFSKELGALESISKYMKENLGMSYHNIAELLNRDERTIWTAYNKAAEKKKETIEVITTEIFIPVSVLNNRELTILESVINYLREKDMKYSEIAKLINRDQRNVRSIYNKTKNNI
jgi:hypothetical protein